MAMMMDRSPHGYCCCKVCVPPKYRQQVRSVYRARERRAWREDVRDLDQGHSPLSEALEITSFSGVPATGLSYWEAMDLIEEIDEDYPTPPGFDGEWSTDSAHVLLMRKRNRMNRVHDSLRTLERAVAGNRYAKAAVKHPRFERVVTD